VWNKLRDISFELNEFNIGKNGKGIKIKIAQISDLHLRGIGWSLKSLASRINKIQPDLLFFTGDSIDNHNNLDLLNEFLQLFNRKIHKVAILGNWEYWGDVNIEHLKLIYQQNNCDLLINQTETYKINGKRICITGIDDYLGGNADFKRAIQNTSIEDTHIILSHCPEYRDIIQKKLIQMNNSKNRIDYIFSGHTHGGQINLFGFTLFLPQGCGKYMKGWYNDMKPFLYVSKGIGTTILPIRFGARAEVSLFNYYI